MSCTCLRGLTSLFPLEVAFCSKLIFYLFVFFFFFQAEDGIRDKLVTGVQTCALPICLCVQFGPLRSRAGLRHLFRWIFGMFGYHLFLSLLLSRRQAGVVSDEADGRTRIEADGRNGIEADSRWTRFRTQHNRLLWSSLLPACLQTAYEAFPERRFRAWSGRRGSNPRQPAWKAGCHKITARLL